MSEDIPHLEEAAFRTEFYGTQITLCVGDNGTGKSVFCLRHPRAATGFFLDLENRYKVTLEHNTDLHILPYEAYDYVDAKTKKSIPAEAGRRMEISLDPLERMSITKVVHTCRSVDELKGHYVVCRRVKPGGELDEVETLKLTREMVMLAIRFKLPLISIDSIEDLRGYVMDKYLTDKGKQTVGKNLGAWGDINSEVKGILLTLFNYARFHDIYVLTTSHFTPIFDNATGNRTRDVRIKAPDFITDLVDEILTFQRVGTHFFIKRGKSPKGPTEKFDFTYDRKASNNTAKDADETGDHDE